MTSTRERLAREVWNAITDIDEMNVSFEQAMSLPHMKKSIEYSVGRILDELMEPGEGALNAPLILSSIPPGYQPEDGHRILRAMLTHIRNSHD